MNFSISGTINGNWPQSVPSSMPRGSSVGRPRVGFGSRWVGGACVGSPRRGWCTLAWAFCVEGGTSSVQLLVWRADGQLSFSPRPHSCLRHFRRTPRYLDAVKPVRSLADNAARLMLAPRGEVRGLVETRFCRSRVYGRSPNTRPSCVPSGVAAPNSMISGQRAGLPTDSSLRDKVERLRDLGYVWQSRNLGARTTIPFRYRILDPAMAFYYEFVSPNEATLERTDPKYSGSMSSNRDSIPTWARCSRESPSRPISGCSRDCGCRWPWNGGAGKAAIGAVTPKSMLRRCWPMAGYSPARWNVQPLPVHWHLAHIRALERLAASGVKWAHRAKDPDSPTALLGCRRIHEGIRERRALESTRRLSLESRRYL